MADPAANAAAAKPVRRVTLLVLGWALATALVSGVAVGVGRSRYHRSLERRAQASLSRVSGAGRVGVTARGHSLTVTGEVPDPSVHLQAIAALRRIPGVDDVSDRLTVQGAGTPPDDSMVVATLPVPPLVSARVPLPVVVTAVRATAPDLTPTTSAPALADVQARVDAMLAEPLIFTAKGPSIVTGLTLEQAAAAIAEVETGEIEVDVQPLAGGPRADQLIAALRDRGADTPRWTAVTLRPDPNVASVRIVLKAPVPPDTVPTQSTPVTVAQKR